jgi:uncharacterized membrane-anchored protein YitT (DUF2179 family)
MTKQSVAPSFLPFLFFFFFNLSLFFFSFFQIEQWKKILGTKVLVQAISKAAGLGDEFPGP